MRTSARTIVVGNIHSGGSGKTPIVEAIASHFLDRHPVIVSRGYRAKLSRLGARIDPASTRGPKLYGDEPWMLAQRLGIPVYIGSRRGKALQCAESQTRAGFFLLDDAFQNFSFCHDLDLVSVQTDRPLSGSYCLPLGDLREGLGAFASAGAVILVKGENSIAHSEWKRFVQTTFAKIPVFEATPEVQGFWDANGPVSIGGKLAAFCGISSPARFQKAVSDRGEVVFWKAFPDHYTYSLADRDALTASSAAQQADAWVTTEKDWYKVEPFFRTVSKPLLYLRIVYTFSEEFWYFVQTRLELK